MILGDDASVNTRIILIIASQATQFEQILFLYWGIKIFSHRMERTIWNKYDGKTPVVHIPVIIVFGVKIYFIAEEILVITLLLLHHHHPWIILSVSMMTSTNSLISHISTSLSSGSHAVWSYDCEYHHVWSMSAGSQWVNLYDNLLGYVFNIGTMCHHHPTTFSFFSRKYIRSYIDTIIMFFFLFQIFPHIILSLDW